MPEYLAPGVYVEEVPSGNKPIQAASTSTAGMVGLAERGPVGTPVLVTSSGAYNRIFGGKLDPSVFTEGRESLPHAAEGFFTNGGSRLYVVRIIGDGSSESSIQMVAAATGGATTNIVSNYSNAGTEILVDSTAPFVNGETFFISDGANSEAVTLTAAVASEARIGVARLSNTYLAASTPNVHLQDTTTIETTFSANIAAGETTITVADSSLITATAGQVMLVRDSTAIPPVQELVEFISKDDASNSVVLAAGLEHDYSTGSEWVLLVNSATAQVLAVDTDASLAPVYLNVGPPDPLFVPGAIIRIEDGTQEEVAFISARPEMVTLAAPFVNNHSAGTSIVANVTGVLTVHARWPGEWGDSLHISSRPSSQVETTSVGLTAAGPTMQLVTAFGLFPGSVVNIIPAGATVALSREVLDVDASRGRVTFTTDLPVIPAGSVVTSQEFSLLIERVENGKTVESEFFEKLSMASEHPRYALRILGSWDTATDRPSETGESTLVRLSDNADGTSRVLPLIHNVRLPLDGGNDDLMGVDDNTYIGVKADDPHARTGIQALENESTLSLVAVPGQVSVNVQKELLAHCEKMRYRFAVLDTPIGSNLQQARTHRQNFDSTRAAIYYPGLVVPNQFGDKGETMVIPSSGHTLGVYARTDVTRGVHKTPANEVLRGIQRFEVGLNKGEQDILNPINLNCMRDFRSENRGLRIYGGRVATSDPEFKYVSVRRLMLFIEQSLDTGLQWAVFEPNSEPLWAAVKQSITGFLSTVWRAGALEGTVQEEAFYVNIGYNVTMTQTDIDNGKMIVEIGVAPVKPAEFVIVRISQKTREATA